jgi:beta-N-acetylhexosaminidase
MSSVRKRLLVATTIAALAVPAYLGSPAVATTRICPQETTAPPSLAWQPTEQEWEAATSQAESMTVEQLAGASLVVRYQGRDGKRSNAQSARNLHTLGKRQPSRALPLLGSSGVILFPDNAKSARQAYYESKAFNKVMPASFFTAVDQEGGTVVRLRGDIEPPVAAKIIGKKGSVDIAKENAFQSGRQLRAAHVAMVFAPVADVRSAKTPKSLRPRTLGYNSKLVGQLVAAQVAGYNEQGVLAVVKHFPGIGSIPADTHKASSRYSFTLDRLCAYDLAPFRWAISAGAVGIMVGHGVYPALSLNPASGSRKIVTELLRDEMGFNGIIITDSMTMKAAAANLEPNENLYIRTLSAGVDLILMAGNPASTKTRIVNALNSGNLSMEERRASIARVLAHRAAQSRVAASLKQYKPGSTRLLQAAQWFAYELKA